MVFYLQKKIKLLNGSQNKELFWYILKKLKLCRLNKNMEINRKVFSTIKSHFLI